jgi:hypothetical protein
MLFNFHPLFVKICLAVIGFVIIVQVATVAFAPISIEPPTTAPATPQQNSALPETQSNDVPGSEIFRSVLGLVLVSAVIHFMWRPSHKEWILYEV